MGCGGWKKRLTQLMWLPAYWKRLLLPDNQVIQLDLLRHVFQKQSTNLKTVKIKHFKKICVNDNQAQASGRPIDYWRSESWADVLKSTPARLPAIWDKKRTLNNSFIFISLFLNFNLAPWWWTGFFGQLSAGWQLFEERLLHIWPWSDVC